MKKTNESIWSTVYKDWKKNPSTMESSSGVGSSLKSTTNVRKIILNIINKYHIESIVDAPCGDFHWMQLIDLSNIQYYGIDIVEEKIKDLKRKFKNSDNLYFMCQDILKNKIINNVNLLICRDILQHLPYKESITFLNNALNSNPDYVLLTTFPKHKEQENLYNFSWGALNLELPPYNFMCKIDCFIEKDPNLNIKHNDKSLILLNGKQLIKAVNNRIKYMDKE